MADFFLKFIGIVIAWGAVVAFWYAMIRYFFDLEMSWKRIGIWAAWTLAGVLSTIGMYYLFPQRIQDIFNVLFDHLICGAALQILMYKVSDYLKKEFGTGIATSKLYLVIGIIYGLMVLDALLVLQLDSHTIVKMADMAVAYVTRAAILMCLALEIKLRTMTEPQSSLQSYDMEDY